MLKRLVKFIGLAFGLLIVAFVILKSIGDAQYFNHYDPKAPLNAEVASEKDVNDTKEVFGVKRPREYHRTALSIEAYPGDRVPCTLTEPLHVQGKIPAIIFLHGSGQRKDFVEEICTPFNKAGFAMLSFDQWNCGERKIKEGKWAKATAWYNRGWKTVCDTRRLYDYMLTRPEIDADRIYLVGASYGAMTGTHVLAQEKRFKAAVLVVGGGDFKIMLDAPLIRQNVPHIALALLKPVATWLAGPFDPILSAPKTGPMPVFMQNGSDDTLVWPEAGKALYAAMAAPKEIKWYPVDHPGLRKGDGPEIVHMLDDGLAWLEVKAGMSKTATVAATSTAETAITPVAVTAVAVPSAPVTK